MRASAPGKLVVSGAYSVLEGAPAIVTAVARRVRADSSRPPTFLTPEVRAAIGDEVVAPWFDAGELREADAKLGLGSSAAILLASLGALEKESNPVGGLASLRDGLFPRALAAHRRAQGGGSGIDVAASTYGGTLVARRGVDGALALLPMGLPSSLKFEVWFAGHAASTAEFLSRLRGLRERDRLLHDRCLSAQALASEQAAEAMAAGDAGAFLLALIAQRHALGAMGAAAGIPIVTPELQLLADQAEAEGACVLPSGAGGGDVALYVGPTPPSESLLALAARLGQRRLAPMGLEAPGLTLELPGP